MFLLLAFGLFPRQYVYGKMGRTESRVHFVNSAEEEEDAGGIEREDDGMEEDEEWSS